MDSPVALALMAKAKRVFEREDTFLSFPLAPHAYPPPRLASVVSGELTAETLLMLSEFSRLVNMIPRGPIWPTEERRLWDVYNDVLQTAQLATSTLTASEQQAYEEARRFLSGQKADGSIGDSAELRIYKQHRDRWFAARQDYGNQRVAAELSPDPATKRQWEQVEAPVLRANLSLLESSWIAEGFKVEVEEAQRVVRALGEKAPAAVWGNYQALFDMDLGSLTDTNIQTFLPTGFSPSNALGADGWVKFTLNAEEVKVLVGDAPKELRDRLAPDPVDLDIELLSFEHTSVTVTRPWLASDVFTARFWRFSDGTKILSDGRNPPAGLCPAYVAALVLARNVEVRLNPDSTKNAAALDRLAHGRRLSLGTFLIAEPPITDLPKSARPAVLVATPPPPGRARPAVLVAAPPPPGRARPAVLVAAPPPPAVALGASPALLSVRHSAFLRLPPVAPPPPPSKPPPAPVAAPSNDVYMMAFICKRLPACPNPDPNLPW